ncbi:hypothetical protein LINPERPRIM_LOCUS2138 [Linum perenne]
MSRTDWLVPIDSFHPHEQKPSFNSMFGSLVRENRRKNHPIAIRDHPLDKMSNQSLARLKLRKPYFRPIQVPEPIVRSTDSVFVVLQEFPGQVADHRSF